MKTIKIFLASSEELSDDRNAFGNLVRRLDNIYEKRGMRIELFGWEDYDAAYNDRRKQGEYNEFVRCSNMFLALFQTVAGKFTIEEFDVATDEFRKHSSPKIYTYCKDLQPNQHESPELVAFKKRLFEELGHYWCRYNNRDSMQLHFIMQLQLVENSYIDTLKLENGEVQFEGIPIAQISKLRFVSENKEYLNMNEELSQLSTKISELQSMSETYPDIIYFKQELQNTQNKYSKIKNSLALYQQQLLQTAQRIARLQGQQITKRMKRAMEAFNEGRVHDANVILDETEDDADYNMRSFKTSYELMEQKRQIVFASIEELQLKASTMLADISIPIEKRTERTKEIYLKADLYASEVNYDKDKYENLLSDYAIFLYNYAFYDIAVDI